MKEFEFSGLRFWVGNGENEFSIDISINQYRKYCEQRGIEFNYYPGIGVNMLPECLKKILSNNWRRKHGLKMIRRRRYF